MIGMKSLKVFSMLASALLILADADALFAQQKARIQEAQVLAILKSLDSSLLKMDARNACTNFAEEAVITVVLFERGEKYSDTYTRKQYQEILEAGFANFSDYAAERTGTQVRLAADGKSATVKSTFIETFRRDGSKMKCTAEESYTFKLSAGKIVIRSMSNIAKMQ